MKQRLMTTAILFAFGATAGAEAGTFAEQRAYDACVDRIEGELGDDSPVFDRTYLVSTEEEGLRIYVNVTAWEDGERTQFRAECATATSGRGDVALALEHGRFARQDFDEALVDN